MFSSDDLTQIRKRGISTETIDKQIRHFITGFPPVRLTAPALIGHGIHSFDEQEKEGYRRSFREKKAALTLIKFVPASGAASRMFKHLFEFSEKYTNDDKGMKLFMEDSSFNSVHYLITHLTSIAFFSDLNDVAAKFGTSPEALIAAYDFKKLISLILNDEGLQYGSLPKGLLKFHSYPDRARTAAEEHLAEAALYSCDAGQKARIHFTISPEHHAKFQTLINDVLPYYQEKFSVEFETGFSFQKPSTDIIAVDEANIPFRNSDGSLLFRPGGHGALLENLRDIRADIIFIKNIDNIVTDRLREPTVKHKEILGGYLLTIRERINGYLRLLTNKMPDEETEMAITGFMQEFLSIKIPPAFTGLQPEERREWLIRKLNRPIRVCGMVKNEGEPGGGPFWTINEHGEESLQIVESSQIDMKDEGQAAIVKSSTHFNPVDLVCSTIDYTGKPFDLPQFVDENTGFISLKSSGGRMLKAQELPGLWNGAMSDWITVFAEVPIITFNPVKTVNDLLRKEHLGDA